MTAAMRFYSVMLVVLALCVVQSFGLAFFVPRSATARVGMQRAPGASPRTAQLFRLQMSEAPVETPAVQTETETDEFANETKEEKYKREKLAEIAERKAAEVFITRGTGRWECQACGYIYAESQGNEKRNILPGTPFAEIETFRCPQCGANKKYFVAETEVLSGFKENQKYGFGGNTMTAGAKTNLIFGGLFIGFAIFMSGYLLE